MGTLARAFLNPRPELRKPKRLFVKTWRNDAVFSSCLRCRRKLSTVDRRLDCPSYEPARCGFCGKPATLAACAALDCPTRGARALEEVAG